MTHVFQPLAGGINNPWRDGEAAIAAQVFGRRVAFNQVRAADVQSVPAGNLAAVDVQSALNELQSDVDTRLPSASYTAADVLAKLLTVDGAGSGLDADLLDGSSSAAFGLVASPLSQFAATTSAQLAGVISDETGSGALVFATSPVLVTPALGTPASGTLTNCTGLPIASGVSGLGASVATFLATPSSANLAAAVTGETGSGALVFATSPALTTPNLGTPSAGTLTNCTGLPVASGISGLGTGVATFLATPSSANLASAVTGETGSGALVFATSPTLAGTPAAPTAAVDTNTTQLATTAYVINQGYLKSASYTAADVLSKLLTVDGAGSGLDADTVDGAHVGTSGAAVPLLNGTNTWSAQQSIFADLGVGTATTDVVTGAARTVTVSTGATTGYASLELQGSQTADVAVGALRALNGTNPVGQLAWVRSGADNSAEARLITYNAGTPGTHLYVTKEGNFGFGVSPSYRLHVKQDASAGEYLFVGDAYESTTYKNSFGIGWDVAGDYTHVGNYSNNPMALRTNNVNRVVIQTDKLEFESAYHVTSATATGTTPALQSGTYTPTAAVTSNIATSTMRKAKWARVGNVVSVSGEFESTVTATGAAYVDIDLPLSSNLANTYDLSGAGALRNSSTIPFNNAVSVFGETANDRARILWTGVATLTNIVGFHFQYEAL